MTLLLGSPLNHIPWQNRPAGNRDVMWRYPANPIITRDAIPETNGIFNSAVVPFKEGFAGVFRRDDAMILHKLHTGFSPDGIRWQLNPEPICFDTVPEGVGPFDYGYDPRCCKIGDQYIIIWCNGYCGLPTIGMAKTRDFTHFEQIDNALLPFNRNGVLFPRKIKNKYILISRPSDGGHTAFGDIYLSKSFDLVHWGEHRLVMKPMRGWQSCKIGAGPTPIETDAGWLLFYHGVVNTCNGFVYSFGAALLDIDDPTKVIRRSANFLLSPHADYERSGYVPNVCFPCAALTDPATGRVAVYYGCADTCVGLCFGDVNEIIDSLPVV